MYMCVCCRIFGYTSPIWTMKTDVQKNDLILKKVKEKLNTNNGYCKPLKKL